MVTAVLVLCIVVGAAYPKLVKNKTQFHIAIALTMLAVLLVPIDFVTFIRFAIAVLQILVFLALILCAGGIPLEELADNMVNAYDAVRHGEEEKPIIVPRTGEVPKEKPAAPTPPPNEPSIPLEPPTAADEQKPE